MIVDSYRFLPRSFRPFYERTGPFEGEEQPVWAPFEKRLSEARIALLTSAGLYLRDTQRPFDAERERAHPEWGDPTWRPVPAGVEATAIGAMHLHLNTGDIEADPEIALPRRMLAQLAAEGVVGAVTEQHYSVMGYQERGLAEWREKTAPEMVAALRGGGADGMILAPG